MAVTMELRDLPEDLADRIRRRAALHGRTPEQEIVSVLEKALSPKALVVTPKQLLAEARAAGISTPADSVRMVREDRDAR